MWMLLCAAAAAERYEVDDADTLWAVLSALSAGDEVLVLPGDYDVPAGEDLALHWEGTEDAPIVVRAEPGTVTLYGEAGRNVINLSGQHYAFSGFALTGGSKGLRLYEGAGITLSELTLYALGSSGITLNDAGVEYEDVTITRVEISETDGDTAGCIIAGCDDGACTARGVSVTHSYCHHTGDAQGAGLSFFSSTDTVVRHNVVVDTSYPGIQIFGASDATHTVEGNLVVRSADNGIQATSGATLANNVVVDAGNYGIELKGTEAALDRAWVGHNTVLGATQACLKLGEMPAGADVFVVNNALLCPDGVALLRYKADAAVLANNAYLGEIPSTLSDAFLVDDASVWPEADSLRVDNGIPTAVWEDFQCTPRDERPDIGAFEWSPDAAAWVLREGFKAPCAEAPDTGDVTEAARGALSGGACACSASPSLAPVWPMLAALAALSRRKSPRKSAAARRRGSGAPS